MRTSPTFIQPTGGIEWTKMIEAMREAALPIFEQLIKNDEMHNPYITLDPIKSWMQIIWVAELIEQHGFVWDGSNWQRSEEDRLRSLQYRWRPDGPLPSILQPQKYPPEHLYATVEEQPDNRLPLNAQQLHALTFGDNGHQVYFSGKEYMILNPYRDRDGKRYGAAWSLFSLPDCLLVNDPADPGKYFADLSLQTLLKLVHNNLGVRIILIGAPEDLPDRYPIFDWDNPIQATEPNESQQEEPKQLFLL